MRGRYGHLRELYERIRELMTLRHPRDMPTLPTLSSSITQRMRAHAQADLVASPSIPTASTTFSDHIRDLSDHSARALSSSRPGDAASRLDESTDIRDRSGLIRRISEMIRVPNDDIDGVMSLHHAGNVTASPVEGGRVPRECNRLRSRKRRHLLEAEGVALQGYE